MKQSNLFHLIQLGLTKTETQQALPKTIGAYSLTKELRTPGLKKPHSVGLYQSSGKNYAIAKVWYGKQTNAAKTALQNETKMFRLFHILEKRARQRLEKEQIIVRVPKILLAKETKFSYILMTEFVPGSAIRSLSTSTQKKAYRQTLSYLSVLSTMLHESERKALPVRGKKELFLLYPLLLSTAILRQKRSAFDFIKGLPFVYMAILLLGSKKYFSLVHRDLHGENVLFGYNTITLLDVQRLVLSHPLLEYGPSLGAEWNNTEFRKIIISDLQTKLSSARNKIIAKGLLILFATHGLTAHNLPEKYLIRYKKVLTFSLTKCSISGGVL